MDAVKKLAGEFLQVKIRPELGGKITSLKSNRSGREWLWHSQPPENFRKPETGCDFASANLGGIDECLPTIEPQNFDGRKYSDHGQVWRQAAQVMGCTDTSLCTESLLTEAPLRLKRRVSLEGNAMHLYYELENLARDNVPYLWAFHPLFDMEEDDILEMEPGLPPCRLGYVKNLATCLEGSPFSWPSPCPGFDLAHPIAQANRPYCAKLFFKSLPGNTATLVKPSSNERLTIEWSDADCPYFGLWITDGGWNGHTHVAFEPTNYPADRFLPHTYSPPLLGPLSKRTWKIKITIEPPSMSPSAPALPTTGADSPKN